MSLFLRLRKQNPCRIALFRFVYNISSSDTHKLFPIGWFMYETFTGCSFAFPSYERPCLLPFLVTHEPISLPDTLLYSPFPGCRNPLFLYTADCVFFLYRYYSIWVASYTLPFKYMAPFPREYGYASYSYKSAKRSFSRGSATQYRSHIEDLLPVECFPMVCTSFSFILIRHHPEVLSQDNNHICLRCDTIDLMWL